MMTEPWPCLQGPSGQSGRQTSLWLAHTHTGHVLGEAPTWPPGDMEAESQGGRNKGRGQEGNWAEQVPSESR